MSFFFFNKGAGVFFLLKNIVVGSYTQAHSLLNLVIVYTVVEVRL
eukprot:SAG11_NODE_3235_length_2592_cov_6.052146_1_plen_45_part_00